MNGVSVTTPWARRSKPKISHSFKRLIGDGADRRHHEAEPGERTPEHASAHSAALRIVSHSRSAWASRGETSG